jgi:hypothetical protein
VHGEKVTDAEQIRERLGRLGATVAYPLGGQMGVVAEHPHPEAPGGHAGHLPADTAEADHPERGPEQLATRQAVARGEAAFAHQAVRADQVPAHGEHEGEDVLGHRPEVGQRRDQDRDTPERRLLHGDVVNAHAVARDHPQGRRTFYGLRAERSRAEQHRVHAGQRRLQLG